jgi:hypothetical protein
MLKKQSQFQKGAMSVNVYTIKDYLKINDWTHGKNKANCRPSAGNPKFEFRNPKQVERLDLKKQTQC